MNEPLDLDLDLTNIDTSFPVMRASLKDMKVVAITKEPNKDKTGNNLVVQLETTEPDEDLNGKPMPVGSVGTKMKIFLALQAKADATDPDGWKKRIAAFQDAALGTNQGTRPARFVAQDYIGKILRCDVKAEENDGKMQNNIKSYTYPQ